MQKYIPFVMYAMLMLIGQSSFASAQTGIVLGMDMGADIQS